MRAEPPPPGFYAPDPYAAWWLWVGAAAFVLIMAWYAWVWRSTRERPVRLAPRRADDRAALLRDEYAREIDAVAVQAASGQISAREAHQRLSILVRHFVQELSGIRAPTMTLSELSASGPRLTPVSEVVEVLYPGEFAPEDSDTVAGAAEVAREVVRRWT
ncbi:MAG TPA: hypothetical protein VFT81_06535 [Dermatophilaceae bacterium]|nr:hypothetical protein [Dermatophilaceae bacterium]